MAQNSFFRLTIPQIIEDYQSNDLTAKGLLKAYFRIKLQQCDELSIVPKEIMKVLGLPRSTFWGALNRLKEEGFLNYQDPQSLTVLVLKKDSEV